MANPLVNEAVRRLIRAGYPEATARRIASGELSMDQASRMARAREQGFDPEQVFYHGTSSDFMEFRPSTTGEFGPGVYMSSSPIEAGAYASTPTNLSRGNAGQNIIPLRAKTDKLFDANARDFWSVFPGSTDQEVVEAAKRAGYEGVKYRRPLSYWDDEAKRIVNTGEMQEHVVIFDPENVRSVNAAFDPEQTGSSNILAGLGGAGVVGAGLMAPEEAEAAPFGTLARMIGKKTRETFHGSPHFFDQVDMSRMGSGEGTQFEGAGFYSAGARETAEGYQRDLSGYYGANAAAEQRAYSDLFDLAEEYAGDRDPEDLVDDIMSAVANNDYSELPENLRAPAQEIAVRSQGAIYRTEIPAEDLLDWDAPLSEQPVFVRNAVMDTARAAKADAADPNAIDLDALSGMTGGDAYEMLRAVYGNDASAELNSRGVLGVQYLDAMSREAGEGTRNYVVFDEANVNVVERNDQPVSALPRGRSLMGAAGATGASSAVASPLDRPEDVERRANARAVAVASDTLERLRRERGAVMSPLQDTRTARFGDYLTENRPSEMDPVQRALQSLGLFQGLGEYLRTTGEGQRTTTMQDINAALDVVFL